MPSVFGSTPKHTSYLRLYEVIKKPTAAEREKYLHWSGDFLTEDYDQAWSGDLEKANKIAANFLRKTDKQLNRLHNPTDFKIRVKKMSQRDRTQYLKTT